MLLRFIDGELFKSWMDIRNGHAPKLTGDGEIESKPADSEFYDNVETLPERRVSKPPVKEEYIATRMKEIAHKLARRGIEVALPGEPKKPGEKSFTYERKVIPKKKNG